MALISKKLAALLKQTSAEVREIGAEAFRTGDDEAVREAQNVVRILADLVTCPATGGDKPKTRRTSPKRRAPASTKGARTSSGKKYPKFVGDRGALARVGWSKKEKREYRHRVTQGVFDSAIQAMAASRNRAGTPVLAERIVEKATIEGEQVPAYQTYVVIGFLKDRGVIKQIGRQGYLIPDGLKGAADAVWNAAMEDGADGTT